MQLVNFDIKASIKSNGRSSGQELPLNGAPLGHTQNMHIFRALEHYDVNISVLVHPRNAKRILV